MNKPPDRTEQSISIRFAPDVLDALRTIAQESERSFNGEVIWALRDYIARRGGNMATFDRFKTIQAPDASRGDDPVRCPVCGEILPMSNAYQVNLERADGASGALVGTTRLFACKAEHAQAIVGTGYEESPRRAPRPPTHGNPNAR